MPKPCLPHLVFTSVPPHMETMHKHAHHKPGHQNRAAVLIFAQQILSYIAFLEEDPPGFECKQFLYKKISRQQLNKWEPLLYKAT